MKTGFVSVGIKDFPTPYDFSYAYAVQVLRRLPAKSVGHNDENGHLDVIANASGGISAADKKILFS